jgi:hypothetical protein
MRVPVSGRRFHQTPVGEMNAARDSYLARRQWREELEARVARSRAGARFVDRVRRIGRGV